MGPIPRRHHVYSANRRTGVPDLQDQIDIWLSLKPNRIAIRRIGKSTITMMKRFDCSSGPKPNRHLEPKPAYLRSSPADKWTNIHAVRRWDV